MATSAAVPSSSSLTPESLLAHLPYLWRVASRLHDLHARVRRRYGDVWDVFQEMMLSCLVNGLATYSPERGTPLARWLALSARNDVLAPTRYQKMLFATSSMADATQKQRGSRRKSDNDWWQEAVIARLDIAEALRVVSPEYRLVLELHWKEGLDLEEVARRLGKSHCAVMKLHAKSLERLRRHFKVSLPSPKERHATIAEKVRALHEPGKCGVDALAARFKVSPQTIRKILASSSEGRSDTKR